MNWVNSETANPAMMGAFVRGARLDFQVPQERASCSVAGRKSVWPDFLKRCIAREPRTRRVGGSLRETTASFAGLTARIRRWVEAKPVIALCFSPSKLLLVEVIPICPIKSKVNDQKCFRALLVASLPVRFILVTRHKALQFNDHARGDATRSSDTVWDNKVVKRWADPTSKQRINAVGVICLPI